MLAVELFTVVLGKVTPEEADISTLDNFPPFLSVGDYSEGVTKFLSNLAIEAFPAMEPLFFGSFSFLIMLGGIVLIPFAADEFALTADCLDFTFFEGRRSPSCLLTFDSFYFRFELFITFIAFEAFFVVISVLMV